MSKFRKFVSVIISFIMILTMAVSSLAADISVDKSVEDTSKYVLSTVKDPTVSSIGGEWAVFGLKQSGYAVPDSYFNKYYANVEKLLKQNNGVISERKYTDYSRVIIALTAMGKDPQNVAGYNLLLPLADYEKTIRQGINGAIWALIAFDCGNYEIPSNKDAKIQATRDLYIKYILDLQHADGGWSLSQSQTKSDIDITAMALQALSNYTSRQDVKIAIDKALKFISNEQNANGGFYSWGIENSESAIQVIMAFVQLGIDLNDTRFVKNGKNVFDNLMSFYCTGGGFKHFKEDTQPNVMSSEQGLYCLAAIKKYQNGEKIYCMYKKDVQQTSISTAK